MPCRPSIFWFFLAIAINSGLISYAQNKDQLVNINSPSLLNTFLPYPASLGYDSEILCYYNGTNWIILNNYWQLDGNDNINENNFIGCINYHPLQYRTNNIVRMKIESEGNVGINLNSPTAQFQVKGSSLFDFFVSTNGNVGIGTSTPTERLHVAGNVMANAFNTPDYVFENYFEAEVEQKTSYNFMPLDEVYEFVKIHKHLPKVPSAETIKQQGGMIVNRATERNLENIEELYLHLFELNDKAKELEQRMDKIKTP